MVLSVRHTSINTDILVGNVVIVEANHAFLILIKYITIEALRTGGVDSVRLLFQHLTGIPAIRPGLSNPIPG